MIPQTRYTDKEKIKLHKRTIKKHISIVRKLCFKLGYPMLGLLHDRSKYSKIEMSIANYWTGTKSPHDVARAALGYSPAWYHHKNKNKHHWEYWLDFNESTKDENGNYVIHPKPVKMPFKYIVEMFCDFVGAGMAYAKPGEWTVKTPYDYWMKSCEGKRCMYKSSENLIKYFLVSLIRLGNLDAFKRWFKCVKKDLIKNYQYDKLYDTSIIL